MARMLHSLKRRHEDNSFEEMPRAPPPSPAKETSISFNKSLLIPEPEISSDAEVQAINTFQRELFAPASIATDTLEKEFLNSSKLSLLERLVKAPNPTIPEQLQLGDGSLRHDSSDMKRFKLERARKIERDLLLRYMDQLLLQENNPSLVNMEVEIMVPEKPGEVVMQEEDIAPPRGEEYLNHVFEQ